MLTSKYSVFIMTLMKNIKEREVRNMFGFNLTLTHTTREYSVITSIHIA